MRPASTSRSTAGPQQVSMATPKQGNAAIFSRNSAQPWASLANRRDNTIRPPGSTATNWCSAPPQSKPPKWVSRANRSSAAAAAACPPAAEGIASVVAAGVTGAAADRLLTMDAPAAGVVVWQPHVNGPLRVDLIRGPRGGAGAGPWGDVLS